MKFEIRKFVPKKIFTIFFVFALSAYTFFTSHDGSVRQFRQLQSATHQSHGLPLRFLEVEDAGSEVAVLTTKSCDASQYNDESSRVLTYSTFKSKECRPDIFFLWTNLGKTLPPVYCCGITAAARNNPEKSIVVFMHDAESSWPDQSKCFGKEKNVFVVELDLEQMFEDTELSDWYHDMDQWANPGHRNPKTCFTEQNLGNAARLALLYKHGGLYLDLDMITINNIDVVGDRAVGLQSEDMANTAAMSFPPKDRFMKLLISQFISEFKNCAWGLNGPARLSNVLESLGCIASSLNRSPSEECERLNIHDTKKFYPHRGVEFLKQSFTDEEWVENMDQYISVQKTFAIHLWNRNSGKKTTEIGPGSVTGYERLLVQECGAEYRTA